MLKNITLGQYFPGNTVVHNLDPRTKIIMTIIYVVALFSARGILSFAVIALYLGLVIAISGVKFRVLVRGLKPLILILTMTGLINVFFSPGDPLLTLGPVTITGEGLYRAVTLVVRIVMLVMGTFIMTYTTSPMALTDGLEKLLGPLKKIRLPVHEFVMIMSMALRFIPTLIEETDKIMSAQKARGANFETGNIFKRARALVPILVPLFISAFRRADELAVAMESRCYHGAEGRTRMRQLSLARRDALTGLVGLLLLALIFAMRMVEGLL